ncbi:MAG: PDZ domain-containing protein, partial [Pirellulales bacterium]
SQFVVTIDYQSRRMCVRPIEGAQGDEFRFGIALGRRNGRIEIRGVVPDNPARASGLTVGDEVVAVDGVDVRQMHIFALRRLLGRSTRGAIFLVRHADGSEATIRLAASPALPGQVARAKEAP